jgi:glycosyltransferase involved in cell wall biosynthesis
MKVLHLSTFDISGGAARACYRLHSGLLKAGIDSQMLVQRKYSDDETVIARSSIAGKILDRAASFLDRIPQSLYYRRTKSLFSTNFIPGRLNPSIRFLEPDIINLHWICGGFTSIGELRKIKKPLIWTLHDMWPFSGGCHYSGKCNRYSGTCGNCPELGSSIGFDLSRYEWKRKFLNWKDLDITIVSPSAWLARCARASSLFSDKKIVVIPNGIDTILYKPVERRIAREILNLPQDKSLVLFGAMDADSDKRKGLHFLKPAVQHLASKQLSKETEILIFGASKKSTSIQFALPTHYLGRIHDDVSLQLVYSAADVFIASSVQDNLANTVVEALACGTPCVAFNIGGMPDLIDHQLNGYLARAYEPEDLASGIVWVLHSERSALSDRARKKITDGFSVDMIARKYSALYHDILNRRANRTC